MGPRAPAAPVDCGSKFGLLQSQVLTETDSPATAGPEPELWREEQKRLAEEEWRHCERERKEAAVRAEEEEMIRRREQQAPSKAGEKRKSNFVDLDDMVEEITTHYMKWIEDEHRQMQEQVEILHRREKQIEGAFMAYRKQMEQELDECIAYIQELSSEEAQATDAAGAGAASAAGRASDGIGKGKSNNNDGEGGPAGTPLKRGRRAGLTTSERELKQWRRFLEQAEQPRLAVYKEQAARSSAAMEETVSLRSDAESYPSTLVALSKQRPSVWRELKRLEAEAAVEEERVEAQGLAQAQQERERVRDALALRAENRTRDVLGVAEKLHVSLR